MLCADLARDVIDALTPDSEWRIDVADALGTELFAFRIVAEMRAKASRLESSIDPTLQVKIAIRSETEQTKAIS
jgi:uncharacterized phage-like protein YoqJ